MIFIILVISIFIVKLSKKPEQKVENIEVVFDREFLFNDEFSKEKTESIVPENDYYLIKNNNLEKFDFESGNFETIISNNSDENFSDVEFITASPKNDKLAMVRKNGFSIINLNNKSVEKNILVNGKSEIKKLLWIDNNSFISEINENLEYYNISDNTNKKISESNCSKIESSVESNKNDARLKIFEPINYLYIDKLVYYLKCEENGFGYIAKIDINNSTETIINKDFRAHYITKYKDYILTSDPNLGQGNYRTFLLDQSGEIKYKFKDHLNRYDSFPTIFNNEKYILHQGKAYEISSGEIIKDISIKENNTYVNYVIHSVGNKSTYILIAELKVIYEIGSPEADIESVDYYFIDVFSGKKIKLENINLPGSYAAQ